MLEKKPYSTYNSIKNIPKDGVLIFGSNTQGRHGKGSALLARTKFGAMYGKPSGLQGRSYAIITKDLTKYTHPSISKKTIIEQIIILYNFAKSNPNMKFYVVYSGIGENLNSYSNKEMFDMFNQESIPNNIFFLTSFIHI